MGFFISRLSTNAMYHYFNSSKCKDLIIFRAFPVYIILLENTNILCNFVGFFFFLKWVTLFIFSPSMLLIKWLSKTRQSRLPIVPLLPFIHHSRNKIPHFPGIQKRVCDDSNTFMGFFRNCLLRQLLHFFSREPKKVKTLL